MDVEFGFRLLRLEFDIRPLWVACCIAISIQLNTCMDNPRLTCARELETWVVDASMFRLGVPIVLSVAVLDPAVNDTFEKSHATFVDVIVEDLLAGLNFRMAKI